MNAKLVEAVARVFCCGPGECVRPDDCCVRMKHLGRPYLAKARAALAAIEAEGYAVMQDTVETWHAWISVNHEYDPVTQHARFNGDIGNWRACWAAAVAKAKEQP